MSRIGVVALALALLSVPSTAAETAPPPAADRVALVLEFLAVGEGSRSLGRTRRVIDVGMTTEVEQSVERRGADGTLTTSCRVSLGTAPGAEKGQVQVSVRSRVVGRGGAGEWRRRRGLDLSPWTSSLVEIAPAEEGSESLVLSVTLEPAVDEPVDALPFLVEVNVGVYAVDGEQEATVQRPRLRTVTGRPARFSFEHPVPSYHGDGVEKVRFDVRVTPSHPHADGLPLRLEIDGEFPGPDGPVAVGRDESATLAPGRRWVVPLKAPSGEGPWLRLEIVAFWRLPTR